VAAPLLALLALRAAFPALGESTIVLSIGGGWQLLSRSARGHEPNGRSVKLRLFPRFHPSDTTTHSAHTRRTLLLPLSDVGLSLIQCKKHSKAE
jgi:hypothetical protein